MGRVGVPQSGFLGFMVMGSRFWVCYALKVKMRMRKETGKHLGSGLCSSSMFFLCCGFMCCLPSVLLPCS